MELLSKRIGGGVYLLTIFLGSKVGLVGEQDAFVGRFVRLYVAQALSKSP